MDLAIMQPYFLPYIGYWQLLSAVDAFVVYDNIQYTKKGWINRNRMLRNGGDATFSIPLKKDSHVLDIRDRTIAEDFDRKGLLAQFAGSYRKAPHFAETMPVITSIIMNQQDNLFGYLHDSLRMLAEHLGISTPIVVSSSIGIEHAQRAEQKVIAICKAMGGTRYINAIGGRELYSTAAFSAQGIDLKFLRTRPIAYGQGDGAFMPNLSIVDVMMFNPHDVVARLLNEYDLE